MFDGRGGGGGEWEKKTRQQSSDPSSVLLLTVGAISCSDGKIRSNLPFLNCPAAAPVYFLFRLWLIRGRSTPRTVTFSHYWPRSCGHGTTLTSSDDFAITSRPCPPQPRPPHDRPPRRWQGFPDLSLASRYGPRVGNQKSTKFSEDMKQGP